MTNCALSRRQIIGLLPAALALPTRALAVPLSPVGKWLAEDLFGGGVIDRLQTVLEVSEDGIVSGTGGCNRFGGRATINGPAIRFSQIAATLMACTPAAMVQERKFFDALTATRSFRVHPIERKLTLLDADEKPVARLARM